MWSADDGKGPLSVAIGTTLKMRGKGEDMPFCNYGREEEYED